MTVAVPVCGREESTFKREKGEWFIFVLDCLFVSGILDVGDTVTVDGLPKYSKKVMKFNDQQIDFIESLLPDPLLPDCVELATEEKSSLPVMVANF